MSLLLRTCVALLLVCSIANAALASTAPLRGYLPEQSAPELAIEQQFDTTPNESAAMQYERGVASYVHRMGQPNDYRSAVYVRDQLKAMGWNAKIVTYVVPIAWPTTQELTVTAPSPRAIDLYEPVIPSDPWSKNHAEIGKPYSGYSSDGDVEGPLLYANHGNAADLAALHKMHVNLKGALLLAKMGGGSTPDKASHAERLGVKALLIYPEPGWDPYFPQFRSAKAYPQGPGRPLGGALRGTLDISEAGGDPTAIGVPVPGAPHKPFSSLHVPKIPVMNVTALVAQQLMAQIGGQSAPRHWSTKILAHVHIGGTERIHFVLKSRRFFGPMWNVIATIPGASAPQETIVIGGHRDAWTYGALDPGSGTVAMLQMARAFGEMHKRGWQPYRTIVLASWDGEELNDFGSGIWVDEHKADLLRHCWAYINTDEVAIGPTYIPYATDDLYGVLQTIADVVTAPDGSTLTSYWSKQDPKRAVTPSGTGSDHESFQYHLGIPSAGIVFGGVFGTWHSAYDDVASVATFDPGMRRANAAARTFGVLTLRLADAVYPDLHFAADALAVQRRLNAFVNGRDHETRRIEVVRTLQPYATEFASIAQRLDRAVDTATAAGDAAQLHDLGRLAFEIRSAFYVPTGITGQPWQGSVLYNSDDTISTLPSLEKTLDPKQGKAALDQLVQSFSRLPRLHLVMR